MESLHERPRFVRKRAHRAIDSDPDQPCGTVVQMASSPEGGYDAIISMQTTAADGGSLHLGQANGPSLTLLALPYTLLADI